MLLRAAAELLRRDPALRARLVVLVVGGPSGTGLAEPTALQELAAALGIDRRGAVPAAAGRRRAGAGLPGRGRGRGAQPQRVVRAGRAGGAGLRHAGRRGRGRRAAGRGRRRAVRAAGATGTAPARGPTRWPRSRCDPARRAELAAGAVRHARAVLLGPHDRRAAGHLRRGGAPSSARPAGREAAVRRWWRREPTRRPDATIAAALDERELDHDRREPGQFLVTLPGTSRLQTHCWLLVARARAAGRGVRLPAPGRGARGGLPVPAAAQRPALRRALRGRPARRHPPDRPDRRCTR